MLLAVMGDSHDHQEALEAAVNLSAEKSAKALFHTGDLISPFMLDAFSAFQGRIYLAVGNCDGDVLAVSRKIPQRCPQVKEYGGFITVDFEDFRVAMTHLPEHARAHAIAGDFDMVLFGHTHQYYEKTLGKTLLLNPGSIMGQGESASFCLVETDTHEVRRLFI